MSNPVPSVAGGVQSVHRAFDLLEALAGAPGGRASVADIATSSGLPTATAHRLLRTLVERGYLRQLPDRSYALGFHLVPLGAAAKAALGTNVESVLHGLVDEVGETANLAVLSGDQAEYVAQAPSRHAMRMFTEIGRRVDLHSTGVGKALLSRMPVEPATALVRQRGMRRCTVHTITTEPALRAALDTIRERGFALDDEEHEIGARCVAVPVAVFEATSSLDGVAVSISGPTARMSDELVARAVPLLQVAAARLRADMSGAPA